jgi:putative ABC transport system permease protein
MAVLMGVFGVLALCLSAIGVYGVMAYMVSEQTHEIGIRMALGARRAQLFGLVLRQGMAPVVLGLAAGIAAALLLGTAIRGLLFEIQSSDPVTIAGVAALLLVVSALACLIPARRAAGTDALAALRFE